MKKYFKISLVFWILLWLFSAYLLIEAHFIYPQDYGWIHYFFLIFISIWIAIRIFLLRRK